MAVCLHCKDLFQEKNLNMRVINKVKIILTGVAIFQISACGDDAAQKSQSSVVTTNRYVSEQTITPPVANTFESHNHNGHSDGNELNVTHPQKGDDDSLSLQQNQKLGYDEQPHHEPEPYTVTIGKQYEGYIEWTPPTDVYYKQAEVTLVSPSGERVKQVYTPGEPIVMDAYIPDGVYKWETVIVPEIEPNTREKLTALRESGDMIAQEQLIQEMRANGSWPSEQELNNNRQSGTLSIHNGVATPVGHGADQYDQDG